jgi:tetratricopeptide (TPR) repeat protein
VSLLLDALKRAEQEKLAREGAQAPAAPPVSVAPMAAPTTGPKAAPAAGPKATLELAAIDTPKAPTAVPAPAPGERSGAQVVFSAKREEPAPTKSSRAPLIAVGVVALLLVIGGGAYVWYQIQALSTPAGRPLAVARPVTPAPPGAPGASAKGEPVSSPPPLAMLKPGGEVGKEAKKAPPARDAAEQAVLDLLAESRSAPPSPPLKLTRSLNPPAALADVSAGYEALKRGDAAGAKRRYEAALATDAANLDALLGLATAEARLGNYSAAARHYRRSLEVDPRSAAALAGLAALADFSRPDALESQLRADLVRYPQSAALHFTLGNLLASRSRWADAQASYFEAHRLDPANPDFAYNLAVALDQLGQPRPAAAYYARALDQSKAQGAQFDARAAERRLAQLRP